MDLTRLNDVTTSIESGRHPSDPECGPRVARLLVRNVPQQIQAAQLVALMAMSDALSVDFANYDVLGVTVMPLDPNTVVDGVRVSASACIVDIVFDLRTTEWIWGSSGGVATKANGILIEKGMNATVQVLNYVGDLSCCECLARPDWSKRAAEFWKARRNTPLLQYANGRLVQTPIYVSGVSGAGFGEDNRSLAVGLADDPDSLRSVATTVFRPQPKSTTPGDTTGGGGKGGGGSSGDAGQPVLFGMTGMQLMLFGACAFIGYRAMQTWRERRYG